ncbi:MAG: hypothetical protein ACTSXQ_07695 [Alphaproteobacteria bacterium]
MYLLLSFPVSICWLGARIRTRAFAKLPYKNILHALILGLSILLIDFILRALLYETKTDNLFESIKEWQTLIASTIAFFASIFAIKCTMLSEKKQTERNFIAARAFLPEAIRQIECYCEDSIATLMDGYKKIDEKVRCIDACDLRRDVPNQPMESYDNLKECILYASCEFGSYLSSMLSLIQIHHSNMEGYFQSDSSGIFVSKNNIILSMHIACYINALASNLYEYARGTEEFSKKDPTPGTLMGKFEHHELSPRASDYEGLKESFKEGLPKLLLPIFR